MYSVILLKISQNSFVDKFDRTEKKTILHFIEKEVNRIRRMVIVAVVTLVEKVRHLQQVVSLGNM